MPDIVDQAAELEEWYRGQALDAVAAQDVMPQVGICYNCGEAVSVGCFCDSDCRDDYELREKQKRV